MPMSDTTILRSVKECAGARPNRGVVRVAGIDEWAWRKGMTFGTVIVDLERRQVRQVVELLADRSAGAAADRFKRHPVVEVVSRDRAGLYVDAARQGAPRARQVAERFHLLKNFRETVERQLGRFEAPIRESAVQVEADPDTWEQPMIERANGCSEVATHERLLRRGCAAARKAMFDEIRTLYEAGSPVTEIARKLGLGPRRVYRWVRRIDLPEPSAMEPKVCTPAYFGAFLARRWAEGSTKVRHLFSDIRHRGYTGSFSHLARFLAPWRGSSSPSGKAGERPSADEEAPAPAHVRTLDGSASLYVHMAVLNGSIRARSSSMPARPYMARFSVLRRLICPSAWPLLQCSTMAFLTASISRLNVRANCCIRRTPECFAS